MPDMHDMKEKVTKVVRNTFSLSSDKPLDFLVMVPEARDIEKLPDLLSLLMNPSTAPKELAQALEHVVISIKSKRDQTAKEGEFLKQVNEIINEPLYEKPQHISSPR